MIGKRMAQCAVLLSVLICASPLSAQPVQQSGAVTPGHVVQWLTNGVVGDGGTAAAGALTSLGITSSGQSFGINSDFTTASGWQALTFGVTTAGGAAVNLNNFGTATAQNIASNATWQMPSLILPQGSAPPSPTNGQIWTTPVGVFAFISGATVGPFGTGGGGGGGSPGGVNGQVQYNNAGSFGGLTNAQLTADINVATASLTGAVPAWPNNTTTFFRGDGTYAAIACANIPPLTGDVTTSGCAATLATVNANAGTWGSASFVPTFTVNGKGLITAASQNAVTINANALTGTTLAAGVTGSSLTGVGTLTSGSTGAGFTIAAGTSTWSGTVPRANLPLGTTTLVGAVSVDNSTILVNGSGQISAPGSGGGTVSSCAQYSVGAWTGAGSTTTINCVAPAANAVLATNGSNVPSLSTSLPTGIGINGSTATWSGTIPGANLQSINIAASGNGGVTGNLPATNLNSGTGASATTYWRGDATWVAAPATAPQMRLTLVSGVPIPTTDQSGITSHWCTPYPGGSASATSFVPITTDGSTFAMISSGELTQTAADNTKSPAAVANNSVYDVFLWSDSGTIRCTRGPAWTSDTARGTGAGTTEIDFTTKFPTNKNSISNGPAANRGVLFGSLRSNGSAAFMDTALFRWTSNVYNPLDRQLQLALTGNASGYASASWKQWNSSAANEVDVLQSLTGFPVHVSAKGSASNTSVNVFCPIGIGIDSASSPSGFTQPNQLGTIGNTQTSTSEYVGYVGLGRHFIAILEYASAGTCTQVGSASLIQSGLVGTVAN